MGRSLAKYASLIMFATRPNFSTAGVLVPIPVFTVGDEDFAPNCTATLTFFTDGTISGAGSLTSYTGNWYLPSTASIGSIYYIKLTVLPGNTITSSGAATGSYLLMSSNRQWTWAMGSTVGIRYCYSC
jgi:hypothetical protein